MIGVVKGFFNCRLFVLTILLVTFFTSCSSEDVEGEGAVKQSYNYSTLELEILNLVNEHRISQEQKGLEKLDEISGQALLHTEHMLRAREVCHHNLGSRFQALANEVGAKAMGENVGFGYRTSEALLKAWLNSPDHRKIIDGGHTHFGISARDAAGKTYVTLIFIRK